MHFRILRIISVPLTKFKRMRSARTSLVATKERLQVIPGSGRMHIQREIFQKGLDCTGAPQRQRNYSLLRPEGLWMASGCSTGPYG
jgi:hypothetical protein